MHDKVTALNMLADSSRTKYSLRSCPSLSSLLGRDEETGMPLDLTDRRTLGGLAEVIDNSLDLADECGWRYALAYLISENVPSEIIQRLLSGGGRARLSPNGRLPIFQSEACGWTGRNMEGMVGLFESLRERNSSLPCANQPPIPSRYSVYSDDDE